jgi:hypothetical protein
MQIDPAARPESYSENTGDAFSQERRPAREADHWAPASAEVKNEWSNTSTARQAQDNHIFTFTLV